MNATTVAVDLAKSVFELAVADAAWRVMERFRLTRGQFERRFADRQVGVVVMEACGSAHHWGRWLRGADVAQETWREPFRSVSVQARLAP